MINLNKQKKGWIQMGGSYYVPRSVKGETRLLYIFTIKSFIATLIFALIGVVVYLLLSSTTGMELIPGLILIAVFGALGYAITSITIPDIPQMGVLRKAGGENIGSMIVRLISFRFTKKKIYLYNYKRKIDDGGK